MSDLTLKRILLIVFLMSVVFVCPIAATITATIMFENTHIKEVREYDEWKVHELYKDEWNYCPNCGAKLEVKE